MTLLEMAKDLVAEQVRVHQVPPDEVSVLLRTTHDTLCSLHQLEMSGSEPESPQGPRVGVTADWRRSISKHAILCLECGTSFRQLSSRHLRIHNLDPSAYRVKYGIPSGQPLSSRMATARRRQLAREIRPWEGARDKRVAAKAATKGHAKR